MTSIMQYLYQQTDEARESYDEIHKKLDGIVDKLFVLEQKIDDLEMRVSRNQDGK